MYVTCTAVIVALPATAVHIFCFQPFFLFLGFVKALIHSLYLIYSRVNEASAVGACQIFSVKPSVCQVVMTS